METWIPDPWLSVIVEKDGMRLVVDLTRRHFRKLTSPFEVIEFDSEQGEEICRAVGVVNCGRSRPSSYFCGRGPSQQMRGFEVK